MKPLARSDVGIVFHFKKKREYKKATRMKKSKMKSETVATSLRPHSATAKPMHPMIEDLRAFYADQIARGHSERDAWRAVCMGLPVCITTIHMARVITQPISHNSVREAQTTNSEKSEKEI